MVGPGWYPTVDGDIIPEFPTKLLDSGRFAHIPHLYGSNSDEGTDNAPVGAINSDDDLYTFLLTGVGFGYTEAAVRQIMNLYPDDPTQGLCSQLQALSSSRSIRLTIVQVYLLTRGQSVLPIWATSINGPQQLWEISSIMLLDFTMLVNIPNSVDQLTSTASTLERTPQTSLLHL